MKRFSIIQPINVTKRSKTYDDIICSFGEFSYNDANNAQKGLTEGLYDWTMDINAEDLNDVFASGQEDNYGKGEVQVLGKRRSVSVGDIIVDNEDRTCWLVSGFGFGKLDFWKPENVWKYVKVA
tara:strand:+ start:45 stop:416 length:372 start_codon:yes stop_codon:yes gene_type:complete